jgi:hypothetical protein
VKRKFVNMIAGLPPATYEEKCELIGLETLEIRRNHQDMAQAYKMIQSKEKLRRSEMFKHVDGGRTRQDADELNLKLGQARLDIRKNFFTNRIAKEWNAVPGEIKREKHVTGFKTVLKQLQRSGADEGKPPESTDGPTMPPTEAPGFYLKVTSKVTQQYTGNHIYIIGTGTGTRYQ